MATVVRVSCADCGDLTLRPKDLRLFTTPCAYECRYAFTCPCCSAWISKSAAPYMVQALRQAGVPEQRARVPREVFEPHRGPAISMDEVLDFALELGRVDDVVRFAGRP
jgi:hypothetical protein